MTKRGSAFKAPDDGKNLEREVHDRYCTQSGQSSIHGDTNYEIQTQEGQSFAFYNLCWKLNNITSISNFQSFP